MEKDFSVRHPLSVSMGFLTPIAPSQSIAQVAKGYDIAEFLVDSLKGCPSTASGTVSTKRPYIANTSSDAKVVANSLAVFRSSLRSSLLGLDPWQNIHNGLKYLKL